MAINDKVVTVNGRTIHYLDAGDQHDEVLLALHGGYGSAFAQWAEVAPLLAENVRVIAPDLPGFGQSDPLPRLFVPDLVAWAAGLLDAIGVEQVIPMGNSYGGLIARIFAATHPQRTPALILVNGGVLPVIPPMAKLLARIPGIGGMIYNQVARSTIKSGGIEMAIKTESVLTPEFTANVSANQKALAKLMRGLSLSPIREPHTPDAKTLLLWGEEDAVTPRVVGEHLIKELPQAKLSLIADVGHMPHLEAPDVFAHQVTHFLNERHRPQSRGGPKMLS